MSNLLLTFIVSIQHLTRLAFICLLVGKLHCKIYETVHTILDVLKHVLNIYCFLKCGRMKRPYLKLW